MRKPVQRYTCLFRKGREYASMKIEAKSDRAALRIAEGYQYKSIGYLLPELKLEQILRFDPAHGAFVGQRSLETLMANRKIRRAA